MAHLIAIANHDPTLVQLFDTVLTDAGFHTVKLPEDITAYDTVKDRRPDLIVLNTWIDEAEWMLCQAVLRLNDETKEIPVLICSDDAGFDRRAALLDEHDSVSLLTTPFDIDVFVERVRQLVDGDGFASKIN